MKTIIQRIFRIHFFFPLRFLFPVFYETSNTAAPVTLRNLFWQKILRVNGSAYWPMHFTSVVSGVKNIHAGTGTAPGLSPGCYIQGASGIILGDYSLLGPNVGLISANHDKHNLSKHLDGGIVIGRYCWIGMNSVVLPGVVLGDHTIVGAGSVVTSSFPEGYCVIAGNPAKLIKTLDQGLLVEHTNPYEYVGYFKKAVFEKKKRRQLNLSLIESLQQLLLPDANL